MIAVLAGTSALAALGLAFGAAMWGLYLGERGRRRSAEAMLVFGAPDPNPQAARRVHPHPLPAPLEPTSAPQGFDQSTIAKGAEDLLREARAAGVPLSEREAAAMAEQMLSMAVNGLDDDISIPS